MRFTRALLLAAMCACAYGSWFGQSEEEKKKAEQDKQAKDLEEKRAEFKRELAKARPLTSDGTTWISELVPMIKTMGAPGQPHSRMVFYEMTEKNKTSFSPDSAFKAGTDAAFLIVMTDKRKDGGFSYRCVFGRDTNALVAVGPEKFDEFLKAEKVWVFDFEKPEQFAEKMNEPMQRWMIQHLGIKMPIEKGNFGGMWPKTAGEQFWGWAGTLGVLFVIVCLCALCCCRGMFHYVFCCCFCKSKPEVKKGEKADPLVLKKAKAKPVYPGRIPEKQHHQSKIKLAVGKSEQAAHSVPDVVIDIEPMSVPDVPAMEVPVEFASLQSSDLYGIEPMTVPDAEPTRSPPADHPLTRWKSRSLSVSQ